MLALVARGGLGPEIQLSAVGLDLPPHSEHAEADERKDEQLFHDVDPLHFDDLRRMPECELNPALRAFCSLASLTPHLSVSWHAGLRSIPAGPTQRRPRRRRR